VNTLAPFRVGSVPYLNAVPLTRGIEGEVTFAPPSELAAKLERDELDAALVSVTAVLFSQRYDILDGVAIASLGEVKSVLLGHRRPLTDMKEVFCDKASLTSVELLRVLLAEQGLKPEFRQLQAYLSPDQMPDYVLLIGDQALDFGFASSDHELWDLGSAWNQATGLPFVYAVWAIRRGLAGARELGSQLREAKAFGLETLDQIISNGSEYTYQFRKDYLSWNLHYHLASDEKRAIQRFAELLQRHGARPTYGPVYLA
jgi:chorismate dehydratase